MRFFQNGTPEAPSMHEVACAACATRVLGRKNSLTQTSIQWLLASTSSPEISGRARAAGCTALRDSTDAAVARGDLAIDP